MNSEKRQIWIAFYPVEELFKLLNEQLHSAGFHCSAKCAIEELKHEENNHCYKVAQFFLHYRGLKLVD